MKSMDIDRKRGEIQRFKIVEEKVSDGLEVYDDLILETSVKTVVCNMPLRPEHC